MRRIIVLATAAFAIGVLPITAGAGEGHDPRFVVEHIFDVADQDQSQTLSSEEYAAAGLERYGVSFEETDANGDGETSLDEYLELYERHHPGDARVGI
ncbi:MAG: hypothetical protein QNK04_29370 [Myxococcota bacterium]|nr:hypothetical protein [Myxococcota bacterium]